MSTTAPQGAKLIDPRLVSPWLVWLLRCLTASWLATALLYALSIDRVPEPIVALATTVVVAVLIATAVVAAGLDQPSVATWAPSPDPGAAAASSSRELASAESAGVVYDEQPPVRLDRPSEASAARPAPPVDLSAYLAFPPDEGDLRQCPRCGSFTVTTTEDAARQTTNTCRICSQIWRSGADLPDPDVVVRSWLHR